MMSACDKDDCFKMRSVAADVIDVLKDNGLATKEKMKVEFTGVHPRNRFGVGVDPAAVHELLSAILDQGFVESEIRDKLWAFQVSPGDAGKAQVVFNTRLVSEANGLLGKAGPDIRILTVAGSHTTQALKCVQEGTMGIPQTGKSSLWIWKESGQLNTAVILGMAPRVKQILEEGMEYLVFRKELEEVLPGLAAFLSPARRPTGGTGRSGRTRAWHCCCRRTMWFGWQIRRRKRIGRSCIEI